MITIGLVSIIIILSFHKTSFKKCQTHHHQNQLKLLYNPKYQRTISNNSVYFLFSYNNQTLASSTHIYSSSNNYWQQRDKKTKEKLNSIKTELQLRENKNLQQKPTISKNSQLIANKLRSNTYEKVYERLSTQIHNQKPHTALTTIQHVPQINTSSRLMERTVDDLYQWKAKIDMKRNQNEKKLNEM